MEKLIKIAKRIFKKKWLTTFSRSLKNTQNIFSEKELFVFAGTGLITIIFISYVYYFHGEYGYNRPYLLYFLTVGLEHLGTVSINSYGHVKMIGLVFSFFSLNVIYWVGLVSLFLSLLQRRVMLLGGGLISAVLLTFLSYPSGYNAGDFLGRGFPVAFWKGIWGMGYSYYFNPIGFVLDLIFYFGLIVTLIVFYSFLKHRQFLFIGKSKALRVLLVVLFFIAVTGGFVADYSIRFVDSYRINKTSSIFENAAQEKDTSICGIFKKDNSLESSQNYNYCLYKAIVAIEDETLCTDLIHGQGGCLREIALAKRDPNICRQLDHASQIATWCMADIAAVTDNIELCAETSRSNYCYRIFFNGSRHRDACNGISDETQREICFDR